MRQRLRIATALNSNVNPNAYGGFDDFFVLDAHLNWTATKRWTAEGGVDIALNRKYFLFHSFPQRTVVAEWKCRL